MSHFWFVRSKALRRLIGALCVVLAVAVFGLPMAVAVLWSLVDPQTGWFPPDVVPSRLSLANWEALLAVPELSRAFLTSFTVAALVTLLCLVLALPSAYAIARRPLRHRRLIELIVLTPLMMPSIILATGLGAIFMRLHLSQTLAGVVLAQTIVILPFSIRVLSATLAGIPQSLLDAARNLGASTPYMVWKVLVPLAMPGVLAAVLLAFIASLEEFILSFVVGMPSVQTLPMLLWAYLGGRSVIQTYAAVVALTLLAPTLVILFLAERLLKQEHLAAGFGKA